MSIHSPPDLQRIYQARFAGNLAYRQAVWQVLIGGFFSRFIRPDASVLDLGCGYGEFINQASCGRRWAMDLNPETAKRLEAGVTLLAQDCSQPWPLPDSTLDVVFTSNFFEHLPDKVALGSTLDQVQRCLKPGGQLIAMGPNIKHLPGRYWDFWDHHLPLTENSLGEALVSRGFQLNLQLGKFLPYSMAGGPHWPLGFVRLYLQLPVLWKLLGKQFLIVAASSKQPGES